MFEIKKSLNSATKSILLILKLVIPFHLLADTLLHFELLAKITFIFEPIASFLNLPNEVTLAIAAGMLFNLYAAIAFAMPLSLSAYEWTVLALFLGIAHSLLVENAIMKKLGISYTYSTILRIFSAGIAIIPLKFLPKDLFTSNIIIPQTTHKVYDSFSQMLYHSLESAIILSIKITVLIVVIIFIMDFIKSLKFMQTWQKKVKTSFSLVAGLLLGITYGAGILISEAKSNSLTKQQVFYIGTFLMLCHAIIEDTLLFVIFGANAYIIVSIRLTLAFLFSYVLLRVYQLKLK